MLQIALTLALGLAFVGGLLLAVLAIGGWRFIGASIVVITLLLVLAIMWPGTFLNQFWFPPAAETAPAAAPVDLCADQVNPAWGNLIAKNSLQQSVYETWLADVAANGGTIFGASKCSLPVDSHVFGPTDTVDKAGPAQLVTDYRFSGIWHPSIDASYKLAGGCTFEPQFAQGDAPIAVYRAPGTIRMTNDVSNGVSLIGQVTCP